MNTQQISLSSGIEALGSLATDSPGKLDILGHDCDTLGVDGTEICILKEPNKVSFCCLLQCQHCMALESQIGLEVLSDFSNKSLEGKFPDEELGTLLVLANFTKGDGSGTVSVWLLHSSGGWGRFTSSLSGELLPGSLASGGLTSGLLGTSHLGVSSIYGRTTREKI